MKNKQAVIWSNIGNTPNKMGDLVLSDDAISFTYTDNYQNSSLPGLSLLMDQRFYKDKTITYPISESIRFLPRLISLVPGNNPRNLQRKHYIEMLRKKTGKEPPPTQETEWQLLMMGGHGGIGHVDVFESDLIAQDWYAKKSSRNNNSNHSNESRSHIWNMLKQDVLDESTNFQQSIIDEALGPTPSVGGMIPKLLASIEDIEKDIKLLPSGSKGCKHYLIKFEPPEYKGLLDLESLCLDLHEKAGFIVPKHKVTSVDGLKLLAIERFDYVNNAPVPVESFFSVIASGNHDFKHTSDIMLDELGGVITQLNQSKSINLDMNTNKELYQRLLMAYLTGNGDMHLDNIAFLGGVNKCSLTPVYDPAPMRAWPKHNLLSAIPFDPSEFKGNGDFFFKLGGSFGLDEGETISAVSKALHDTNDYLKGINQINGLPENQRQLLNDIVEKERSLLSTKLKAVIAKNNRATQSSSPSF